MILEKASLGGIAFWGVTTITVVLLIVLAYEAHHLETYAATQNRIIEQKTKRLKAIEVRLNASQRELKRLASQLAKDEQTLKVQEVKTAGYQQVVKSELELRAKIVWQNQKIALQKQEMLNNDRVIESKRRELDSIKTEKDMQIRRLNQETVDLCQAAKGADARLHARHGRADSVTRQYVSQMMFICGASPSQQTSSAR
jgi:chromosome condensin MukBEF ATPase and DNA-binding subunit MukB